MSVTRRWGVRAAAFVATAVIASGIVVPAASATAPIAPAAPTLSTSQGTAHGALPKADLSETAELVIAPTTQVYETTDRGVEFHVLLRNTGKHALPEGSIELALEPKVTERQPDGWVTAITGDDAQAKVDDTETAEPTATVIATEAVGSTGADAEQSLTISVPADDFPLTELSEPGVYTVTAHYMSSDSAADDPLTASTPIIWRGADRDITPVKLSIVVPFVLPAEITTMPTPTQLSELAPEFDALLDFATDAHAILAIDPRIIAAIRGYGTEAPDNSRALLERLESTSLTSFLLQYGDADLTPQAALNLGSPLEPVNLDFVTRFGAFEVPELATDGDDAGDDASVDPESPDATASGDSETGDAEAAAGTDGADSAEADADGSRDPIEPGVVPPPTLEELGAWERGIPGAWPSRVTNRTLSYLESAGFTFTVLSSNNADLEGGPRAKLGSGEALVTDAALDDAVRLALTAETQTERELGVARAHARLVEAAEAGVKGLGLGIDRGAIIAHAAPVELLEPLVSKEWVRTVGLSAQASGIATLRGETLSAERVELLDAALRNESHVLEARSMLVNPEYLDGYQRMRLLTLFSTRYANDDALFAQAANRFERRDAEIRDGVSIVASKHAQLVGASSRIPVQLRNSLPFDIAANVTITPTSAALAVEQRTFEGVIVANDSNDRVLVPVSSRISSGESGLHILVTSAEGDFTAASAVLDISISTSIETIALTILGLAAVLLFSFGIWRSVRRRRAGIARI